MPRWFPIISAAVAAGVLGLAAWFPTWGVHRGAGRAGDRRLPADAPAWREFDLVAPRARLDILATRQQALRRRVDHLDRMARLAASGDRSYAVSLLAFQVRQAESELAWVGEIAAEEARRTDEGASGAPEEEGS